MNCTLIRDPHYKHSLVATGLSIRVGSSYHFGDGGGPGGWIILIEPEVMLGDDLLVPDLAGWKRERLPHPPANNWTAVAPDWVCEILSPNTYRTDRIRKMPIYAAHGVSYLWLIDPAARLLETYRLRDGLWLVLGNHADNDRVRAEPFPEAEIDLAGLWWGD